MEKLGREELFRKADGITTGARIGSAQHKKLSKNPQYVKLEPRPFKDRINDFDNINIEVLTKVNGIGASTAKTLGDAEYISVKGIAESTPEKLVAEAGLSLKQAVKVHNAAKLHLESNAE